MEPHDILYWVDILIFIGLLGWLVVKKVPLKSPAVPKPVALALTCLSALIFSGNLALVKRIALSYYNERSIVLTS